ncbi:MAG: hypothetical protein NXI23_15170 [Bacteroidetes bacterium]|jgi:hypothetical protein|nr:hypothetical protein [Bacteroidota bacterium]MDF1866453.1 hypothetical protein [Saprospiraceae bacterium]
MNALKYAIISLSIGIIFACSTPPEFPLEPVLTFESISKDTLNRGYDDEDQTEVIISFTDGDGDLSGLDTNNMFLIDTRTGFTEGNFTIPDIPPVGVSNGISGDIIFTLKTTCCNFPEPGLAGCEDVLQGFLYDTVVYEVYVIDQSGHESNHIFLDPIYIRCFD